MLRNFLVASLLASACGAYGIASGAPVYKLLYSPPSSAIPGGNPTTMFEVAPGLFYVLSVRETNTFGPSVFTITGAGTFKLIYSFQPATLMAAMVQGTNARLYGPGHLSNDFYFSLSPFGGNPQEYPFPGSWGSAWQTIVVPPGELYDIVGRVSGNSGVYGFGRIDEAGKITILHQFSGSEGVPTGSNIAYGPDGNVYGIGSQNIGVSSGFIYRFTLGGAYSQLLSFPSFPDRVGLLPLIAAADGSLYGTFGGGGVNGTGEIYQATLSGQLHTVASFPATGMIQPESLMQAADGNIYGSTNSNHIFRYNLATHQLTTVYQLDPSGPQGHCTCQLIEGMDGKLYGVTPVGGNYPGIGAIFSLNIGLPKPKPVVSGLFPAAGPIGQKVLVWGKYLLGATSVTFNGTPASADVATSVQSVHATVPVGATTGPVTITTANGSFTTTENFTVQ